MFSLLSEIHKIFETRKYSQSSNSTMMMLKPSALSHIDLLTKPRQGKDLLVHYYSVLSISKPFKTRYKPVQNNLIPTIIPKIEQFFICGQLCLPIAAVYTHKSILISAIQCQS